MTFAKPTPLLLADGRPAASAWTLTQDVLHLNHGSFGAVPKVTQDFQNELRAHMEMDPVAWFVELPAKVRAARLDLTDRLRAPENSLVFVPNASAGATVVFNSLDLPRGSEILVTNHGYGAVTMGAMKMAKRLGCVVKTVEIPLAASEDQAFAVIGAAMTSRTSLLVLDQVTSPTARLLPVQRVVKHAKQNGVLTLIDGAHVLGLYDNVFEDFAPDFWVGNLHKFACSPRGAAVLVCQSELTQDIYPLVDSWGYLDEYPQRFDIQGTLDQTSYLAASRSLDFVEEQWGWPTAVQYMTNLVNYGEEVIRHAFEASTGQDHRATVAMPANAMRLIALPSGMATTHASADQLRDRFARECDAKAAFTSFDGVGYLRISAHVYNTAAHYERFAQEYVPKLVEWGRSN